MSIIEIIIFVLLSVALFYYLKKAKKEQIELNCKPVVVFFFVLQALSFLGNLITNGFTNYSFTFYSIFNLIGSFIFAEIGLIILALQYSIEKNK